MSTNKTQNYALHSWVKDDTFLMDEMNENFAKLDGKLKEEIAALDAALKAEVSTRIQGLAAKAEASTVAALDQVVKSLTTTLGTKADKTTVTGLEKSLQDLDNRKIQISTGTYEGFGGKTPYTVELGVRPRAVFIMAKMANTNFSSNIAYGYANRECPLVDTALILNETGFTVANANSCLLNNNQTAYLYIALY